MRFFKSIFIFGLISLNLCSCNDKNSFVIHGSVNNPKLEGEKIFLVPIEKEYRDQHGVDSAIVKDMKFTFTGSNEYLARVTVDYRIRLGLQELLLVTEPGEIEIIIDSISEGHGTPQNDALQRWKNIKSSFDKNRFSFMKYARQLQKEGDSLRANIILDSVKTNDELFRNITKSIANSLEQGVAYDFLNSLYPNEED